MITVLYKRIKQENAKYLGKTYLIEMFKAINRLTIIWKWDLTNKMKRSFFQAAVASILLYRCTTSTLTKRLEKKLDGNYRRMLWAILNKSWRQHPTRHQLYGHLPLFRKTIQVRRTRHAGHCWRSRDELIRDVLLWTPTHGRAKAGRPARTYIQQLCEDTGCCPEDLPRAMNDREEWRERVRDIRSTSTTWWWWWWLYGIKISKFLLQLGYYIHFLTNCYGEIPHTVTAWTLPTLRIVTDSINESNESSQFPVTFTVCISVNIYYYKHYISLCYSFRTLQDHNSYTFGKGVEPLYYHCYGSNSSSSIRNALALNNRRKLIYQ